MDSYCSISEMGPVANSAIIGQFDVAVPDYNSFVVKRICEPLLVLLIHSDLQTMCRLQKMFMLEGHRTIAFEDGIDALEWLGDQLIDEKRMPDLVVADIFTPGRKGIDFLVDMRYAGWATPFILLSQKVRRHLAQEVRKLGSAYVFDVPFDSEDFLSAVSFLTRYRQTDKVA